MIKCLAQGHNAVLRVRLEPSTTSQALYHLAGKLMRVFPVLYLKAEKKMPKNQKNFILSFYGVIQRKKEM